MVKILINAIGKERDKNILALQAEYLKMLPWEVNIKENVYNKDVKDVRILQHEESKLLMHHTPASYKPILLDEKGRQYTSQGFADLLGSEILPQHSNIAFLIGGAFGHSTELKDKGLLTISLSSMTFAHKLVRLILLEQIYRAYTIISGHPYHK
jgi:23S rRNA (pseudouridine1915-N3)-methyltransferase